MKTINLRYCYPYYTGDVFVEVSDEVAEVIVQSVREMYNYDRRARYHKAFYSLDAFDWTEKYALEHSPSAEEIILMKEERKDKLHQAYLRRKANGTQKRYENKIRAKKKAEIEAKKAAIRAEDMENGVFIPASSLPKKEPQKAPMPARAAM